jgi:hypothetical protein
MDTFFIGLTVISITTAIMVLFLIENILIWTRKFKNTPNKKTNLSKNKPPYY